jgi:CRISPR-associated protein Csx10
VSRLTLTLEQPAQFGDRARKDFVLSTMEYIPGSVVRGAFAAAWLARYGVTKPGTPERKQFLDLFEGGVRFGALFREDTEFMSLAVVGHKYDPDEDACEIVDYDRAMTDDDPPMTCPQCRTPIELRRSELPKGMHGDRPGPGRRTSVAIDEHGVARDGQLFTRELLQAGQEFRGTLIASKDQQAILTDLGPIRVGGRRTTHGLAKVAINDAGTPPTAQQRKDGKLVIRLRTPGIFTDDYGRPAGEPSPADLHAALGVKASVADRWIRWEQSGGWHVASGLPKPQELTVAAGSTYLIEIQDHEERFRADASLAKLAAHGLGLRRHEGFGDLAPPPFLRPGKAQRDAEIARLRRVADKTAPLRALPLKVREETWTALRTRMASHASGDPRAAEPLCRFSAGYPDAAIREAMTYFLSLSPADARHVVEELTR